MKRKVLILETSYLPGYRSGGPQRTIENICDLYSNKTDIYILTKNHDLGEDEEYDLPTNAWLNKYGVKIKYVTDRQYGFRLIYKEYKQFDNIFSGSLFSPNTYMILLIHFLFRDHNKNIYIAPMGVFSKRAFQSKRVKKRLFVLLFSFLGIFDRIVWCFSTTDELDDARRVIKDKRIKRYIIAEDPPRKVDFNYYLKNLKKKKNNRLDIVFISRICPQKNLLYCMDILNYKYCGEVFFSIYGLVEDEDYWKKCTMSMEKLLPNIHVSYNGEIKPSEVIECFNKKDVFLFPTKGENYGHIIYEAMSVGCIPIISNLTPWKDLQGKSSGYVLDIEDRDGFRKIIQDLIIMDDSQTEKIRINAINYAKDKYNVSSVNSGWDKVFLGEEV